jgi:O-antigen/teichoic acid export membrane protein
MFDNVGRISRQLAAYGTADVAVLAVNVLLLPIYTRVLSTHEYGALALLLVCEAFLKVINRWGLDAGFLRFYYDYQTDAERRTLAGTIASFMTLVNGAVAVFLVAAAGPINRLLFDSTAFLAAYHLLVLNSFAAAFLFLPLNLLRIQERPRLFATLTFLRSFGTIVIRLILVVGLSFGLVGIVLADVAVTAMLLVGLGGTFRSMLAWRFSPVMLRDLLAYGFPHVPHGLLSQTMGLADRFVLGFYMPLREVGLYLIGSTVAAVLKLYPVAFEAAWMPFAFDSMERPEAPTLFARMGTYAFAVLAFLTVAMAGLAPPAIMLLLPADYHAAATVVPLLAVGMAVQSLTWFLATSLNIAKQTRVYPVVTAIGAGASVATNLLLIPPLGMVGAAVALLSSQALAAGVTGYFAQRVYRIPYELARLGKVVAVGTVTYVAMTMAALASPWQTLGLRAGLIVLFPIGLLLFRFFDPPELGQLQRLVTSVVTGFSGRSRDAVATDPKVAPDLKVRPTGDVTEPPGHPSVGSPIGRPGL